MKRVHRHRPNRDYGWAGSVLSLNVNILPVFEQLGLYEELLALSVRTDAHHFMYEDLNTVASLSLEKLKEE